MPESFGFLDFFAGSGLVSEGVKPYFRTVWANDISVQKAAVFLANHERAVFHLCAIQNIAGQDLPQAMISWASFPCQDLSVAGKQEGINGERSGLVWTWLKIMEQMPVRPPILVAENVSGLTSTDGGQNYQELHRALVNLGYLVGPIELNALHWLPQSRKRIFIVAVSNRVRLGGLTDEIPNWLHPVALQRAANFLAGLVWWKLPKPSARKVGLSDLVDYNAPFQKDKEVKHNLSLIPPSHMSKLISAVADGQKVFPGYKRTRHGKQVLEIRLDNISGCLRTAKGGSSREFLIMASDSGLKTRLLTVRETARLMGAPEEYQIPGDYNAGYSAMGDAVALPVTRYLAEHLLLPLARRAHEQCREDARGLQEHTPSSGQRLVSLGAGHNP